MLSLRGVVTMVHSITEKIIDYCLCNGIVTTEDTPWLRYGIEKRISKVLNLVPFFLLALYLTNPPASLSFLGAFYLLKQKTGGIHAKTVAGCICASLLTELVFLAGIYTHLNAPALVFINVISTASIFTLAPFNHPNMHLSGAEIISLQKSSRKTTAILQCTIAVTWLMGFFSIAKGLTTGVAMAAFLLSLAYINDWRTLHERTEQNNL